MESEQKLYNEETIALLKDIRESINQRPNKEVDVHIDTPELLKGISDAIATPKPTINVEPAQVIVEHHDLVLDTSDLKSALEKVSKDIQDNNTVRISNPTKSVDSVTVKNMKMVEKLLKELVAKETVVNVDTKAPKVDVSFPTSLNPKEYIPVRLTDGQQFYNSISGLAAAVNGKDERFTFDINGNLKTTAVISGDVIVDEVGLENVAGTKINPATEDTLLKIPGLAVPIHDYISATYNDPAFTEVYVYKTGGSGGTTVATVTVVYVDATKAKLVSVTKT